VVPDDFGGKELATSTSEAPIPRCAGSGSRQRWTRVLAALCSHRLVLLSDVWCRVRRVLQNSLIWIALAANRSFRGLSLVPNCGREQRSKTHSKRNIKTRFVDYTLRFLRYTTGKVKAITPDPCWLIIGVPNVQ
jgi:hypothetical protein